MPAEQTAAQAVKADPGAGLLTRPGHKQLPHLLAPTVPCIVNEDSQYQAIGFKIRNSAHVCNVFCWHKHLLLTFVELYSACWMAIVRQQPLCVYRQSVLEKVVQADDSTVSLTADEITCIHSPRACCKHQAIVVLHVVHECAAAVLHSSYNTVPLLLNGVTGVQLAHLVLCSLFTCKQNSMKW